MNRRGWLSSLLLFSIIAIGVSLGFWKYASVQASAEASARQPEPMESVMVAAARDIEHRQTTTSIGTVLALRSVMLKNELAGTVREVRLTPGQIVEAGTLLVALDVSVEEADLKAQEAQAALAKTVLNRRQNLNQELATTQEEVDRARADLDIAQAQIARTKAIIAKKTIRAPFLARVGIADVHTGQYLNEGTLLTTLQGVSDAVHVDFTVAQQVAAGLREGSLSRSLRLGRRCPSGPRSSPWMRASIRRLAIPWCGHGLMVQAICRLPARRSGCACRSGLSRRRSPFRSVRCARDREAIRCS